MKLVVIVCIVVYCTLSVVEAKEVCEYRGKTYGEGQKWYDGCELSCECKEAGRYVCSLYARCPVYDSKFDQCELIDDPSDPCCKLPTCHHEGKGGTRSMSKRSEGKENDFDASKVDALISELLD